MCRVLAYLGQSALLDDLLYQPDSSLIRQTYDPQMLHMLNLAGFGVAMWDAESLRPEEPYLYRSTTLPMFDANLRNLARKLKGHCMVAHVRGVAYHPRVQIGELNLHPFQFEGAPIVLAHNGDLHRFAEYKTAMLREMAADVAASIRGTTDSEHLYALLLTELRAHEGPLDGHAIVSGVERTLRKVKALRAAAGVDTNSAVNLFVTDGKTMVVVRFTFDFGRYPTQDLSRVNPMQFAYLSMWYSLGKRYEKVDGEWSMSGSLRDADSAIFASEPLTRDTSTWLEVPEYTALWASRGSKGLELGLYELDV